jgi:ABC-type transport system substrate-binding protein
MKPPSECRACERWRATTLLLAILIAPLSACDRTSAKPKELQEPQARLTLTYNAEEQSSEKSAVSQVLQAQLSAAGIPVALEPSSNTIFNDRLGKGQFQAVLSLWYLDYADPEGFLTDFYSKAGFRMSKYSSARYDSLYLAGLTAPTESLKVAGYHSAAALLDQEIPWIPLYSNTEVFLLRPGTEEFRSNAYQYYDYRRVKLPAVRVASDVELQTLDPAQAYDLASKHVVTQSYEGLVAMDEHSKIVPSLATDWSFSANHDTLTFHLRPGVTFHPSEAIHRANRAVDAADVKASFQRMIKANSPYAYIFDYVAGESDFKAGKAADVSGFRMPDAHTFQVVLTKPFPTMLPWLLAPAAYVLPKELPAKFDFAKGSVGTGPFILRSWNGSVAQFDANPAYSASDGSGLHLPMAKSLSIRILTDVNAMASAFKRGELDVMNVPLAMFPSVFDTAGALTADWKQYTVREVPLNNLKFIAFNMQASPWGSSAELRRRVEAAIDRDAIVRQLFRGKARIAKSIVPSGMPGFD